MSHQKSVWDPTSIKDWDQYLKSLGSYIKSLGESTGRCGDGETIRCHACGTWVETIFSQFSRYDGEPLCRDCAEAEGTDE